MSLSVAKYLLLLRHVTLVAMVRVMNILNKSVFTSTHGGAIAWNALTMVRRNKKKQ